MAVILNIVETVRKVAKNMQKLYIWFPSCCENITIIFKSSIIDAPPRDAKLNPQNTAFEYWLGHSTIIWISIVIKEIYIMLTHIKVYTSDWESLIKLIRTPMLYPNNREPCMIN